MLLADDFVFSQNNLQQYQDCKRKFYLKHIEQLQWPALVSEPTELQEARTALGAEFHMRCEQFFSGVPESVLHDSIESPEMLQWWSAFEALGLQPGLNHQAEKAMTVPFLDFRLTAHYDLLISNQNGKYLIYDWKTNLKQPLRMELSKRMQTLVYPLVLQLFREAYDNPKASPEEIELNYWYPVYPTRPFRFLYNNVIYQRQKTELETLVTEIMNNDKDDFQLTDETSRCSYCQFRSFCNRGSKAGIFSEGSIDVSDLSPIPEDT